MISDNIKQLIIDGTDFDVTITARIESKDVKNSSSLLYAVNETCAKIKKNIKMLNDANEIHISIKSIKTTSIKDDSTIDKSLPRYPWRRKGLVYQPVEGMSNMQYTTLDNMLIVEYDKMHFKIMWVDVQKLLQLPESELHRKKLNVRLNSKGVTGLLIFIKAIKEGKVKTPDAICKQPEEKPIEAFNFKDLNKIKFNNIPNEKFMSFGTYKDNVVVRLGDIIVTTSWREVNELSKLSREITRDRIHDKFPKSVGSRNTLALFVNMYKEGKVVATINTAIEDVPMHTSPRVIGVPTEEPSEWKAIKAVAVRGAPDFSYKTKRDSLLLHRNGTSVVTDWNIVVRLSQYHKERLTEEINKLGYTGYNSTILLDFVKAYNENRVIDPDAGFRKMLSTETTTRYDGSKIEGTLEE